jgi:GTP cyclohydrolase IB
MSNDLPDIQDSKPAIQMPIREVGVENVQVPFILEDRDQNDINMVANVSMRTNLAADIKGISMSRLIRTLSTYLEQPLKQVLIKEILEDLMEQIGSSESHMRFDFQLPIERRSVKSNYSFPVYHDCRFEGRMIGDNFKFFQGAIVQYASYCPCSAELSNHLEQNGSHGFPHAQRSFANILVEAEKGAYIWLEDVIDCVEKGIKTLPYPIIKRVDEQAIAEIAAKNPIFVEDAIRQISVELNLLPAYDWIVKCSHEESIHTSEAIAVNWKGITNGFDYKFFL